MRVFKSVLAATALLALAAGTTSTGASAYYNFHPHFIHPSNHGWYGHSWYGNNYGWNGGFVPGAISIGVSSDSDESDCTMVRRRMIDVYGNVYYKRVPVCG